MIIYRVEPFCSQVTLSFTSLFMDLEMHLFLERVFFNQILSLNDFHYIIVDSLPFLNFFQKIFELAFYSVIRIEGEIFEKVIVKNFIYFY